MLYSPKSSGKCILFIALVLGSVYLWKTPEARNNIYEYYSEVLASLSDEEIIDVEEVFSISYDPAVQTSIIPACRPRLSLVPPVAG